MVRDVFDPYKGCDLAKHGLNPFGVAHNIGRLSYHSMLTAAAYLLKGFTPLPAAPFRAEFQKKKKKKKKNAGSDLFDS